MRTTATMVAAVTGDDRGIKALLHSQTGANKLRSSKSEGNGKFFEFRMWIGKQRKGDCGDGC